MAAAQTTDSTHSVHALVRLLKSSADPPSVPGPSKIEIASLAWSDPSFRAANKAEVIGEWILTLLGQASKTRRERGATSTSDPIANHVYWTLLCDVLTTPLTTDARPMKTWLFPLLNRLQLETIVIELLVLRSLHVLAPARAALAVLWPLAEKRIGVDPLGECLGVVFDACTVWEYVGDDLGWICSAVVSAYRNAFANAGNKKKVSGASPRSLVCGQALAVADIAAKFLPVIVQLYSTFLTAHLSSWLGAISTNPSSATPPSIQILRDSIYAAGTDTLFSLDALKQPLDTLFSAFSDTSLVFSLLPVLPRVFTSFLSATHQHRSALFASNGKEDVRKRGMDFVGRCWTLTRGSANFRQHIEAEIWKAIIGIFEIVGKERLFVLHSIHDTHIGTTNGECGGESILREARDAALEVLEHVDASSKDRQAELAVLSIQLLDVLVRIEYGLVGPILERVLSALINVPPPLCHLVTTPASELLTHVLEFHAKTRTIHTYAVTLLGAVGTSSTLSTSQTLSTRTFPLAYHLLAFERVLRTSITLTQVTPLATVALQAVENSWKTFKDAYQKEERVIKKRKVVEDVDDYGCMARSAPAEARVFCYTSRVAGTILSNLPANAYTEDEEYFLGLLWNDAGKLGWTVIWDCLEEKSSKDEKRDTLKGRDGKKRSRTVKTDSPFALYPHTVISAALRFLYDIRARVSLLLGDCDRLGEAQVETLLSVVQDEGSDTELVLETIRTLFWHVWYTHSHGSQKQMKIQQIFAAALDITAVCPLSKPKPKWYGAPSALTRENLSIAVLHILTNRWIDVLDALASTENLEKFMSLLLTLSLDLPDENPRDSSDENVDVALRGILLNLLRNAQFWELHNIRAVFLSFVLTSTTPLSPYCSPTTDFESPSPTTTAHTELTRACDVYKFIGYAPPEYLTRSVRAELIKRAMAGDVWICTELKGLRGKRRKEMEVDGRIPAEELKKWSRRLTFVRVFLQHMGQLSSTPGHTTCLTFVNHLLSSTSCVPLSSKILTNVTLDLIQLHIVSLLRSQEPEATASLSNIITTIAAARPFSQPNSQETWTHTVVESSALNLIERLSGGFDLISLPDVVKKATKALFEGLESALLPHAQRLVESDVAELDQSLRSIPVDAWSHTLSLMRWLRISSQIASIPLGLTLTTSMVRSKNSAELDSRTLSSVFGLLFEELWCIPDAPRHGHLDALVTFYVVNGGNRGSDTERIMDACVTQASKKLSVEDFSHVLDVLVEGIAGSGVQACHCERLIHLGRVILDDAPQGTVKVVQSFVTRCFNLFADRDEIHGGSSQLKLQFLEFIARHCSDRPTTIRSVDLGSIWSILDKILSGSSEHETVTTFPIFHNIIATTGALIRLRRDLVVHTLPHLSRILRQLMMLNRKMRPQLGAKQNKIVMNTFPSWLSASQPLSTDEARAFARLLTSLTTKTVPRVHAHTHPLASTESRKAESLAKPFAKHASYVLVAYVDAFNDPLCIIDAEMRKELEPGLFSLCEMVGEHSRDALMASALDSGGKMILKSLWREYEKQRYTGKG